MDTTKHAFNKAVDEVLGSCLDVSNQRGGEYQDSWALGNNVTTFLDATLRAFGVPSLSPEQKRLLLMAALVDVKDSRMLGPYKDDTLVDSINYRAAYAGMRKDYESKIPRKEPMIDYQVCTS